MKKLVVVLAAALLLSGCTATSVETTYEEVTATPEPAPITMESSAPAETDAADPQIDEATYLRGVTEAWHGTVPSDAELIAAGRLVCEQMNAGAGEDDVVVVTGEGDDAEWNNDQLVLLAVYTYCPEFA